MLTVREDAGCWRALQGLCNMYCVLRKLPGMNVIYLLMEHLLPAGRDSFDL